ncbi:MAG: NADP-dependent phosphogluconate dehydrogenase [Candidatus Gracilibacteria bacterium]
MPQNLAEIGIIGLGTMGSNFARNLANKGIVTAVYNRTTEVTEEFIAKHGSKNLIGTKDLQEFVQSIKIPRKITIIVKAGPPVDAVLESLTPLLDPNDIVLDFGNTHFNDTERREQELKEKSIHFWGCGISGGEKGALHGPSLMPGGPKESWPEIQPILEAAAAKDFGGSPCVTYLGPGAAGNYVKMVHNGIEYGIMQMLAEAYDMMKTLLDMPAQNISQVFRQFDRGKLNGYLLDLSSTVAAQKDDLGDGYLIDKIMDKAAQKGTGSWTSVDGLQKGIALPTITEAVTSRIISSFKERRKDLAKGYQRQPIRDNLDTDRFVDLLDDALYVGIICTFAQGLELIQATSDENGWNTNLAEVTRIWQGGCIIRMILLEKIQKAYNESGQSHTHLLEMPSIIAEIKGNIASLKEVVEIAAKNEVAIPALSSALNYFYAMTQERGSANFIQALRDGFGAHTFERIDREGIFHAHWESQ